MPEPTKGPWRASWSREGQSWSILREDGHMIANAFESEANARRIAAVPVMEKALEEVMRMCFEDLSGEESGAIIDLALAAIAIAKAKGE